MTITITMTPAEEVQDPDSDTGLTEEAYGELFDALSSFGWDIQVRAD